MKPTHVPIPDSEELATALGDVVDDYLERRAAGERPDVSEYAQQHPEIADLIRQSLRALEVVGDTVASAGQSLDERSIVAPKTLGDFRILGELGRGGMGIVYEAHQISMGRDVALKVLPLAALARDRGVQRFHNEVRAAAALDHPNIVSIYSVGEERGVHYYAMRLIRGQSLAAVIRELATNPNIQTRISSEVHEDHQSSNFFRSAAELGVQAAEALQHAHDLGVLHRDIKPSNLMLDASGDLFITDFGLARIESDVGMTMTGDMVGTLRYMSPEQALGKRGVVDHRCDIYALGVTLYELLTLRPPFNGADRQELLRQIAFEEPPKLRTINPSIPADLQTIVLKAIERDRDQRYESAGELAADLRAFLKDLPIKAKPPTTVQRAAKWSRRHRTFVRTALATLTVAIFVGGTLLWKERSRTIAALGRETQQRELAERHREIADGERRRSQQLLYLSDMKLASDALQLSDIPRVSDLLDRHRSEAEGQDLRDFVWHYLHKSVEVRPNYILDVNAFVSAVEASPDGVVFCASTKTGQIQVYQTSSGKLLRTYRSVSPVNDVAWHPSGRSIASACADGSIRVWSYRVDLTGLDKERDESTSDWPGSDSGGQSVPLLSFAAHHGEANSVCFTPDSKTIISCGDDQKIHLSDSSTGQLLSVLQGHQREVEEIAISADGLLLASASSDKTIALWDLSSGSRKATWTIPHFGLMLSVCFSPDQRYVAAGDLNGALIVVNTKTGKLTAARQLDAIESVAFLADSHRVVTGDWGGATHVWTVPHRLNREPQLASNTTSQWSAHRGRVESLTTVPGTQEILSGSRDGYIASWSPDTGSTRWTCSYGQDFAIGNDDTLFICDQEVFQCDLDNRQSVSVAKPNRVAWTHMASAQACSRIVTGDEQGYIAVYDWRRHEEIACWKVDHAPYRIAISPEGRYVAIADFDKGTHVEVYEVQNPTGPRILAARHCSCVEFGPNGNTLAVGSEDDLLLYDLHEGGPQRRCVGHATSLKDASFHPDGRTVATVSDDRRLKLWDVGSGKEIRSTEAHEHDVDSVDFSDDGRLLVTGGRDSTVRVWHAQTLQPLLKLGTRDWVKQVRFASHDRRLIARLGDGEVIVFDSLPDPSIAIENPSSISHASLVGLGNIAEAESYTVKDISEDGRVIVGDFTTEQEDRSFRWSWDQGIVVLPLPDGYRRSFVSMLGDDGQGILGRFHKLINTAHIGWWPSDGGSPAIDPLSENMKYISPADMVGSHIVGGNRIEAEETRAFHYNGADFEKLSGVSDQLQSSIQAVANNGSLLTGIVWSGRRNPLSRDSSQMHVVQWRNGKATRLPGFSEEVDNWFVSDTSADGSVIVGKCWPDGRIVERTAFRWEAGKVSLLDEFLGSPVYGSADRISDDGRVIVGHFESRTGTTAFVWDATHGMRSLKSVLHQHCVDTSGWQLQFAVATSADGTMIAGQGIDPYGRPQAFLARLPLKAFGQSLALPSDRHRNESADQ